MKQQGCSPLTLVISVLLFCSGPILSVTMVSPRVTNPSSVKKIQETNTIEVLRGGLPYVEDLHDTLFPVEILGGGLLPNSQPFIVNVMVKDQLGLADAMVNIIYSICNGIAAFVAALIMAFVLIIQGFVTASWQHIWAGVVLIILSPFAPLGAWVELLIQYGTPMYYLVMFVFGLPLTLGLCIFGSAGPIYVPVLTIRIFIQT